MVSVSTIFAQRFENRFRGRRVTSEGTVGEARSKRVHYPREKARSIIVLVRLDQTEERRARATCYRVTSRRQREGTQALRASVVRLEAT